MFTAHGLTCVSSVHLYASAFHVNVEAAPHTSLLQSLQPQIHRCHPVAWSQWNVHTWTPFVASVLAQSRHTHSMQIHMKPISK